MIKKILLVLVSVLVFVSCSNNTTSPGSSNNGDNSGVTPPIDNEEEELIKKYGIDISQEDAVISQKIEENLKAYFAEKNSYRVILTGTPKDYSNNESLYTLTLKAAVKVNTTMNIELDLKNIDFKDSSVKTGMFSGNIIDNSENIVITFAFPTDKIKTIEMMSFDQLYNTKEITLPDSVITIKEYAFQNSQSIEKLTLGNGVQSIGDQAFLYVQALKELIIPDSVKSIGMGAFSGSFIEVLKLSSSLESIGDSAFDSSNITELTIPASIKSIGSMAFAFSRQLTTLTYLGTTPNTINNIGDVFIECSKLTTLIVPNAENDKDKGWETFLGGSFTDIRKQ